jgi:hypothetical protein
MVKTNKETIEENKEAFTFISGIMVAILGSVSVSSMFENAKSIFANDEWFVIVFWSILFLFSTLGLWQSSKAVLKRIGIKKNLWMFDLATFVCIVIGATCIVLAIIGVI